MTATDEPAMAIHMPERESCRQEYEALLKEYGRAQVRCSELVRSQADEIRRLQADAVRLRAAVIARDSALAWAREDRAPMVDATPADTFGTLEASLVAADLVICQTGCLSHGAYWRVRDHCKRTGKTCVLVEQPAALRIVRIGTAADEGALPATSSAARSTP